MNPVDFPEMIRGCLAAVSRVARRTPLIASAGLNTETGATVLLKPECEQITGSFKIRGAAAMIASLDEGRRGKGVVTASSGNHGRAVAYVAREMGARAVVCVSTHVPEVKVEAIRGYGAEVRVSGDSYEAAEREAIELQDFFGMTFVSAFDDPLVIAGQGTVGTEIIEDCPDVATVVVPLSGGGLISGIAMALKNAGSRARIVGVSMERAPMMYLSLKAGRPVEVPEEETLADALMGSIGGYNTHTFDIVRNLVDDVVLVSEEEIFSAMGWLKREHGLTVEGGGAVGVAALRSGRVGNCGAKAVVVLSGGNVDPALVDRAAASGG